MGRIARRNSFLAKKIEYLQITLRPFIQFPEGPIHPAFPATVASFHLLTEDELDSLAHFYHQSTPGPFSMYYPAPMNWDKEFLARTPTNSNPSQASEQSGNTQQANTTKQGDNAAGDTTTPPWLIDLMASIDTENLTMTSPTATRHTNPYARLSKDHRIRIKRRKFGKFIGFRNMDTPADEIYGRLRASLDSAIERSRAEMKREEEISMGRRKGA